MKTETCWESFWSSLTETPGEIFWDADPAHAAQEDLVPFQSYADPQLPIIDLGCGNGTQTRFLGDHFAKVIGTEISPAAVEISRTKNAAPNISYRILDVLCPADAQALHDEIGDANLYMRTVSHQLSPADHATAIQSIERLLGVKGVLYLIELSSALLRRSLRNKEAPSLPYAQVLADEQNGLLTAIDLSLRTQPPDLARELSIALLSNYVELVGAFIGEQLTQQLILETWPELLTPRQGRSKDE